VRQRERRETLREHGIGWAVALEDSVRDQGGSRPFGSNLLGGLSKGQRFGLSEQIRHKQIMLGSQGVQRVAKADEIAGDEARALVQQLVERMLTVGALLAPYDGRGGFCHGQTLESHMLAIAFHGELLQVAGKRFMY